MPLHFATAAFVSAYEQTEFHFYGPLLSFPQRPKNLHLLIFVPFGVNVILMHLYGH